MTKREKIYWTHIKWCKRFNKLGVGYSAKSYPKKSKEKLTFKKTRKKVTFDSSTMLDGLLMPLGPALNPDGTPKQFDAEKMKRFTLDEPKMWDSYEDVKERERLQTEFNKKHFKFRQPGDIGF